MNALLEGIYNGFILFLIVCVIWIYWAEMIYKWDSSRIGNLILQKYGSLNQSKIIDGTYFNYANVIVSPDKSYVTADIQLRDAVTQEIKNSESVKYTINNQCNIIDLSCIAL